MRFDTTDYRRSHSRGPRGWGAWAFFFDREGVAWFAPRSSSFTEAKRMAEAEGRRRGARVAHVAP